MRLWPEELAKRIALMEEVLGRPVVEWGVRSFRTVIRM